MPPDADSPELKAPPPVWHALPAWLLSLVMHLVVALSAVLLIRPTAPKGTDAESDRLVSLVLARRTANATTYFADEPASAPSAASPATARAAPSGSAASSGDPFASDTAPPPAPGIKLPALPGMLASGEGVTTALKPGTSRNRPIVLPGIDEAAILAADAAIPREAAPTGPTARMSLFGSAEAEGRSFVFVIDRSQSMGGDGLGAISAVAKELAAQLASLTPEQKVQAVAYNQTPVYFTGRELLPADDGNKKALVRWVSDLAAFGPTEHERGLLAALKLKPEVIFLLTDGEDPYLNASQFRVLRDQAGGRTSIHCLHFGRGPPDPENFLRRLAAENRGSYVYIDMGGR